ncbi:MAG: hypothetical protein ACYCUI_14015 [Vulcanimicrobiaceae bacterium]
MMLTRVSNIETFRRWRLDENATLEDIVARLTHFEPTEAMKAGTAFHKALEMINPGDYSALEANGYTFIMPENGELSVPDVRELRLFKEYGPLRVTGQVDAVRGKSVKDYKTTASFSPDGYFEGCQWRFYLDIFEANVFEWIIFEISPDPKRPMVYRVKAPHVLAQVRYPALHDDCMRLAQDFHDFAQRYLPSEYADQVIP